MGQDEEYQKSLDRDGKKQAALEGEVTKLEELRSAKAVRVADKLDS